MGTGTDCIEVCARRGSRGIVPPILVLLVTLLGLIVAAAGLSQETAPPTIDVEEIQRGLRGYGLSVFSGNRVERFDVEVLGLMRNTSPDTSYILARLEGQDLEKTGVIAGMSGSPVYLDGRLAGAVAFSWNFSKEAIAGITPIAAMRDLARLPSGPGTTAAPMTEVVDLHALAGLDLPEDLLERRLALLRPRQPSGALGSAQFSTLGFGLESQDLLRKTLGAVAPAGRAEPGADLPLEPGGVVAGILIDGDLSMTLTGTVTERNGDEILALGHSFLGLGPTRMPMAAAEIVTVVSSVASSFKISNLGPVVGAFDQDRMAGLRGRVGLEATTIPVRLEVAGLERRSYDLRLADLPILSPTMMATAMLEGVTAASYAGGSQSLDLEVRFDLAGYEDLVMRQSFDGIGATMSAAIYLLQLAGYLVQNPLEQVVLQAVEIRVEQSEAPRAATLVGAHAERTQIRPGDRVKLNLDFVPYRGEPFRHSTQITTPADLPAGKYYVFVGDGTSIDAARLAMEPAEPQTLSQALDMLRSFQSRRDLGVLGVFAGRGLSVAGQVMPRLPGSVRSIWQAAATMSATPLALAVAQEQVELLDRPIDGLVRLDLEVLRREPVEGSDSTSPSASEGRGELATVPEEGGSASPPEPSSEDPQ